MQNMKSKKGSTSEISTDLLQLDLKYFAGTLVVSASVILLAIQALNPCSILGGLIYSLVGLSLIKSSKTGLSIVRSLPVKLVSLIQYNICNLFDEGTTPRMILEMSFAYMVLSRNETIPKDISINVSNPLIANAKNNNIVAAVISSISSDFPAMVKKSKGSKMHLFKQMSTAANAALIQEIKARSLRWIEENILKTIKRLSSLLHHTLIRAWGNILGRNYLKESKDAILIKRNISCCARLPPKIKTLINPFMDQTLHSPQHLYLRLVVTAIVLSNMMAFRLGVHPRCISWLRNIILLKLINVITPSSLKTIEKK